MNFYSIATCVASVVIFTCAPNVESLYPGFGYWEEDHNVYDSERQANNGSTNMLMPFGMNPVDVDCPKPYRPYFAWRQRSAARRHQTCLLRYAMIQVSLNKQFNRTLLSDWTEDAMFRSKEPWASDGPPRPYWPLPYWHRRRNWRSRWPHWNRRWRHTPMNHTDSMEAHNQTTPAVNQTLNGQGLNQMTTVQGLGLMTTIAPTMNGNKTEAKNTTETRPQTT